MIKFPLQYPFKPPDFIFTTAICHPNVHSGTGDTCHDRLNATWMPSINLTKYLSDIHELLNNPNYETPVEGDKLLDKNSKKAYQWTQQFAQS